MAEVKSKYKRVVIKLSGEALQGKQGFGIDSDVIADIAEQIKDIHKLDIEIAIVIGGGNIFRGRERGLYGIDRATADYMGMLATVINGLALQDALEKRKVFTRVMTAIQMHQVAEPYIRRRADRHLSKKRVVIFVAGTGSPYFTTDTTAALRAIEIGADAILKATKVDGVYSSDPQKDKTAVKYSSLTYMEVLEKGLGVMDATAISLCMDNNLPIVVFDLFKKNNIKNVILGKNSGTFINSGKK